MFIAKGPLVRGYAIPDNLGDVAAASGQVRLFRSMTMMGGVQKIRFCIRGEKPRSIKSWQTARVGEAVDSGRKRDKTFSTANGIAAEEFNALPSLPSPYFTIIRNLPCLQQQEETMVTWIGVPLSTPLTTGAFFYSPLQPSRTLPLVWSEIDGILRYISHGLKMHASPLVSCTSLQSCLIL